jgi:hypothetical protein
MVAELPPQARAERALELSVNRYAGAPEYVMDQAQYWRGKIRGDDRLDALLTTAVNSPRIEVRMAGFEVFLAQYDLDKSADEVERLLDRFVADPAGAGPWALWSLGVMAARGVERERIMEELLIASHDPAMTVRRWAVDALARLGGVEVVEPLLQVAVSDSSTVVRERAFCGLAQSATLHLAERYEALPGLLAIVSNPQADAQTLEWGYQAMREITNLYRVPEDPDQWKLALAEADLL